VHTTTITIKITVADKAVHFGNYQLKSDNFYATNFYATHSKSDYGNFNFDKITAN